MRHSNLLVLFCFSLASCLARSNKCYSIERSDSQWRVLSEVATNYLCGKKKIDCDDVVVMFISTCKDEVVVSLGAYGSSSVWLVNIDKSGGKVRSMDPGE